MQDTSWDTRRLSTDRRTDARALPYDCISQGTALPSFHFPFCYVVACVVAGFYPPSVRKGGGLVQTETAMQQAMAALALIGNNSAMRPMNYSGPMKPRGQVVLLTLIVGLCMWSSMQQVR